MSQCQRVFVGQLLSDTCYKSKEAIGECHSKVMPVTQAYKVGVMVWTHDTSMFPSLTYTMTDMISKVTRHVISFTLDYNSDTTLSGLLYNIQFGLGNKMNTKQNMK